MVCTDASCDVVDLRSDGASASPETLPAPSDTGYAYPAASKEVVDPSTTTRRDVVLQDGGLSSLSRSGVAANSGNRVFWSGGQAAKEAAADFATANGAKTLEMTTVGRALERLPYNRFTAKLWDAASAGFAATARGDANVFIGPSFPWGWLRLWPDRGPDTALQGKPDTSAL